MQCLDWYQEMGVTDSLKKCNIMLLKLIFLHINIDHCYSVVWKIVQECMETVAGILTESHLSRLIYGLPLINLV